MTWNIFRKIHIPNIWGTMLNTVRYKTRIKQDMVGIGGGDIN